MKKIKKFMPVIFIVIFLVSLMIVFRVPPFAKQEPPPPKINVPKQQTIVQNTKNIAPQTVSKSASQIYSESMKSGAELTKKGYYSLAINEYNKASNASPGSTEPLIAMGKIYLSQRNPDKAIKVFSEVVAMGANNDDIKINLSRAYLQNGDIKKSKEIFETVAVQNEITAYYKGLIAILNADYENSKNLLSEAAKGKNEWIKIQAQTMLGAFEEFAKFEAGQASHLKTLLAKALNQNGEFSLAIPLLKEVIKEKKDYRDAWVLLGYAYLNNSQSLDAVTALEEARKLDPSKPETLFFLGLAYFAENKIDNAITYIELAVEKGFEPHVQAYQKLAELYFIKQDYAKSAKAYETVIGINGSNVDYFVRPMWIYIEKLRNPTAALSLAQTSLIQHPGSAMAYNLIGWAYTASGDYSMAKKNLETAIKIDPSLSAPYLNMGQMYEKMGYLLTAKDYYKQAFTIDKNATSIGATAAEKYNRIAKLEEEKAKQQSQKIQPGKVYQVNTFAQNGDSSLQEPSP